jgi:Ca2+-binding EF-hand superfamily protein
VSERSKLKFHVFLKCVLDFQLREHEKFLSFFVSQFKQVDSDRDGVINEQQFASLMASLGFREDYAQSISGDFHASRIDKFLELVDPFNNNKITFSECVHLLSSELVVVPVTDQKGTFMQQMAILEHLSGVRPSL